ncbi:uncharacterized protein LOC143372393 [Andrena cerasifolii]|uniref:uncharacterized protein LOC143372393 n=1 Tax=Andrena cerasifolii TaxID=2819439 RepID=UPI004037AEE5
MWLRAALITVLQLTTLLIGGTTPDTDFAIKEFQDHPGIYFENLGDLQIYRDSWKLILHLDISYIYRRESNLQAALYDILAQCKTPSTNNLQKFCKTFGTKIQSKVDRVTKFLTYVQQTISSAPKQRRGLIDGLGYIGKSLFGLMDSEDRKIINDQIDFLKRQDSRLKNTIKGQMQIVRANAELLNETIHNVQENEKTLLNTTWQIQYLLQQTTDITRFRETIDENLILINSVAETLLRDTQDLLEFIMDIKKGVLNPQLMPPAQIRTYLTSALAHIPQGLDFPIGIKLENMHVLYDILTLSAFSDTKSITVVLDIPLLSAKKFKLSKVHPVPTKVNDSFYAYIEPLDSYVVLDTSVQDYIQLSKQDLTECKTINELYLCTSNHPMFKAIPYGRCEVVVDAFAKFVWIYPTKTTNAAEVVKKLAIQQKSFGNPKRIISDKGAAFTSKEFKDYCVSESIEHFTITTGIPRANGQVERINRTIISVLTKLSIEKPDHWYKHVDQLQRCLNSSFQRAVGMTPFEVLFGVKMKQKGDKRILSLVEQEAIEMFDADRDSLRRAAEENIIKIQAENRRDHDKTCEAATKYKEGDLVAIQRTQFGAGLKIEPKFLGPYKVVKVKRNNRYEVVRIGESEGPGITSTAADYMKPYLGTSSGSEDL